MGRMVALVVGIAAVGAGCEQVTGIANSGTGVFDGSGAGTDGGGSTPTPQAERCDHFDNDGDGEVDETCPCKAGQRQSCYAGPPKTLEVGACKAGEQACPESTSEFATWGECKGQTLPAVETCNDNVDNDCDGIVDEASCCQPGASDCAARSCAPGQAVNGKWVNGKWGDCRPAPDAKCGTKNGFKSRSVSCDGSCCDDSNRPADKQACSLRTPHHPDNWVTDAWSNCSVSGCGKRGKQTRSVSCSGACCDDQNKPTQEQPCETAKCNCVYELYIDQRGDEYKWISPGGGPACLSCCADKCSGSCSGSCGNKNRDIERGDCYKDTFLGGGSGDTVFIDDNCKVLGTKLPKGTKRCASFHVGLH